MIYALIGISLLFIILAFCLTGNNARYILSGYNTMSTEQRKNFDLKAYLPYFRTFHIFLGISLLLTGLILYYLVGESICGFFLCIYPMAAYIYFIWHSKKYYNGQNTRSVQWSIFITAASFLLVTTLLLVGFKEDKLIFDYGRIKISGIYGEQLNPKEIASVELINDLPEITFKTNGFALGDIRKGYFKTTEGETVKLILNSDKKPYLLFTMKSGNRIFISTKDRPAGATLEDLKKAFPDLTYLP